MTVMVPEPRNDRPQRLYSMSNAANHRLDHAALAAGAAECRTQLREQEAAMEEACQAAVERAGYSARTGDRSCWDTHAWRRYVDEAFIQAHLHLARINALRSDAEHLEHVLECLT